MKTFYLVLLSGYVFFVVGLAAASVGKDIPQNGGQYSIWLPFLILMMMGFPAIFGYLIGKERD